MLLNDLNTERAATTLDGVAMPPQNGTWSEINARVEWAPAKFILSQAFWQWYAEHSNDTILHIKKLVFVSVRVRVHHLYEVFKLIFGNPVPMSPSPTYTTTNPMPGSLHL